MVPQWYIWKVLACYFLMVHNDVTPMVHLQSPCLLFFWWSTKAGRTGRVCFLPDLSCFSCPSICSNGPDKLTEFRSNVHAIYDWILRFLKLEIIFKIIYFLDVRILLAPFMLHHIHLGQLLLWIAFSSKFCYKVC